MSCQVGAAAYSLGGIGAGDVLVKEYIDDGYTGKLLVRPALERMRADLKTDLFEAVYFHSADRIARDVAHQIIIVGELLKYGKQIVIDGKDYKQNPENKLTLTMLGAFAEFEHANGMARPRPAPNLLDCGWGSVKQSSRRCAQLRIRRKLSARSRSTVGKNTFHLVGLDKRGAIVLQQKVTRLQLGCRCELVKVRVACQSKGR